MDVFSQIFYITMPTSIAAFAFLMVACSGWGYALVRWAVIRENGNFAFQAVVGVACLTFLGGMLNLVRLAYPLALIILLLSGLIFFAISCSAIAKMRVTSWRAGILMTPDKLGPMLGQLLPIGILILAVAFYILTLLPSEIAFNCADDFQTYIPRVIQMMQTGSIAGNPFDFLGIDLGAYAFLQGFVLLGFPIKYLLGFDVVFSFALAGLLLIEISKKFKLHWIYPSFALLVFIVINPQAANISALYMGSAIILGILFASCHLLDQIEKSESGVIPMRTVWILGLLMAAAIAVKTSFASYVLVYCALLIAGLLFVSKDKRKILKIGGLVMLSGSVALLPWLALHATNYASVIHAMFHPPAVAVEHNELLHNGNIIQLFSNGISPFGGSFLSYGIIVQILAVLGTFSWFKIIRSKWNLPQRGYFIVAAAACVASIFTYFFNGLVSTPVMAVRYSCPILIATLPFTLLAASMAGSNTFQSPVILVFSRLKKTVILSMSLLVVASFWPDFVARIEKAYYHHSTPFLSISENYLGRIRYTTSQATKRLIREIQYKTQPGQKILAWIDMPGHLDFSRNEIYA